MAKQSKRWSILRSSVVLSVINFASKCLGLVRDFIIVGILGTGSAYDIYIILRRIPQVCVAIFVEGTTRKVVVPEMVTRESDHNRYSAIASTNLLLLYLIGAVLLITLAVAPGYWFNVFFSDDYQDLFSIGEICVMFIAAVLLFALPAGSFANILAAKKKFTGANLPHIWINVSVITLLVIGMFGADRSDVDWLIIIFQGMALGWLAVILHQGYMVHKLGISLVPKLRNLWDVSSIHIVKNSSILLPLAASQPIANLVVATLAISFGVGSAGWFGLATQISTTIYTIVMQAVNFVLLPFMSLSLITDASSSKEDRFTDTISRGLKIVILAVIPAACGLALTAELLIEVLLERGKFTHADTIMTAAIIVPRSLGIPFEAAASIFVTACYAMQKLRLLYMVIPAWLICKFALIYLFAFRFDYGVVGLGIAIMADSVVQFLMLYLIIKQVQWWQPDRKFLMFLAKALVSVAIMAGALLWYQQYPLWFYNILPLFELIWQVSLGVVVYVSSMLLLGVRKQDVSI